MLQEPVVDETQEPSTGLTTGVVLVWSQLRHHVKVFEQVAQGDVQLPLSDVLTHSPFVAAVYRLQLVIQYPSSKLNPELHDNQLLSLYPDHSAQLEWHGVTSLIY